MDSLQQHELKALQLNQDTISSSVDHARRQRALELQYERRRKTLEVRRKSCQGRINKMHSIDGFTNLLPFADMAEPTAQQQEQQLQQTQQQPPAAIGAANLSSSAIALMTPKNTAVQLSQATRNADSVGRKLEFGSAGMSHSAQSLLLRRTSESDTSTHRRRRTVTADERRRSSRNLEKCIKLIPATSSSSGDDSEDGEQEMRSLLQQSRDRLEDTRALKIRCHLLRPEDYVSEERVGEKDMTLYNLFLSYVALQHEIINTCRDNIRCLEAVLKGPPGTVLSTHCSGQTKGESTTRCRLIVRLAAAAQANACSSYSSTSATSSVPVLAMQPVQECKCAAITRFVARVIDFMLDVSNLLEHFSLYRFLAGTLRSLYALVNRPMGRLERLFGGLRGLL